MSRLLPQLFARRSRLQQAGGFTLLELLVVVGILAAISTIGVAAYTNVLQDSDERLVRAEMQEIAKAIRQFKADTGYYPGEGPFGYGDGSGVAQVTDNELKELASNGFDYLADSAGWDASSREAWFKSPANFYQLVSGPLLPKSHQLYKWDAESGRGWRGPYLTNNNEFVDVGDDLTRDYDRSVTGNESNIVKGDPLKYVRGIADTFDNYPVEAESYSRCEESKENADCILDWRPVADDGDADDDNDGDFAYERHGRPYLFIHDTAEDKWFLVSMGPDGKYCPDDNAGAMDTCDFEEGDNIILRIK